jgi:hypothetical protein
MNDRTSKLIGAAIAAGLFLNAAVGLAHLLRPVEARAAGTQAVYLTDFNGAPLDMHHSKSGPDGHPYTRLRVETTPLAQ